MYHCLNEGCLSAFIVLSDSYKHSFYCGLKVTELQLCIKGGGCNLATLLVQIQVSLYSEHYCTHLD